MPVVTVARFREVMKGTPFATSEVYEDPMVEFWLDVAEKVHDPLRWKTLLEKGICLYAAHHLVGDALANKEAERGGIGGLRSGMITSESGDSVSVSYDVSSVTEGESAGHFNSTVYGRRWYHLARLFGAGALVVGTGGGAGNAWPGAGTILL